MKFLVVSPHSSVTHDISWVDITTAAGNFVIQDGHEPTVLTLTPNSLVSFCLKNGAEDSFAVRQGIVEVQRHEITIILQHAA